MPHIKIVSPTGGQTVLGDKVTLSFIISDFSVGQDGYLNLWLDNPIREASTAAKIASQYDHTLSDLPAGSHTLNLEAIKSDHTSFNPPVVQSVSFVINLPQKNTETLSPVSHSNSSFSGIASWQYLILVIAVIITLVGFVIKYTYGKPKIWQ